MGLLSWETKDKKKTKGAFQLFNYQPANFIYTAPWMIFSITTLHFTTNFAHSCSLIFPTINLKNHHKIIIYRTLSCKHRTESVCGGPSTRRILFVLTSHTRTVLSDEPDTMVLPEAKPTEKTWLRRELGITLSQLISMSKWKVHGSWNTGSRTLAISMWTKSVVKIRA